MATREAAHPVYCRNCYIPMEDLSKDQGSYHWLCERCGLEWKPKDQEVSSSVVPTKISTENKIRSIIAAYGNSLLLNEPDFNFMLTVLENHPQAQKKIGSGVVYIYLDRNPLFPSTRTFFLVRADGSSSDFSWIKCLRPQSHKNKVLGALRSLIYPQVASFKKSFFHDNEKPHCEIRSTPLTFQNSHVDHQPPVTFDSLVRKFLKISNLNFDQIKLKDEGTDNTFQRVLADNRLAQKWIQFHKDNAVLRVISAEANLIDVVKGQKNGDIEDR